MQIKSLSFLCLALVGSGAFAQAKPPEPDYTLAYNIGATTDYRFRGISQTSFDPAIQGGVDFTHKSGFYLGTWVSNIKWIKDYVGASKGSVEWDLYGGYKGEITKDLTFDVGLIRYEYPRNTASSVPGFVNANTTEVYGALTYGIFTAKYSSATSNFIANPNSDGSGYLDLSANFDLGGGFTLTPHVGHQTVRNTAVKNQGNYSDYSLTLAKDFGNGFAVTVAAIGSNASKIFYNNPPDGKNLGKSTLVVGAKYSF
jgi:uncharacterized protein (TIGR02001 family)